MRRIVSHFAAASAWVFVVAVGYLAITWVPFRIYQFQSKQLSKKCVEVTRGTPLNEAILQLDAAAPTIAQFNKASGATQVSFGTPDSASRITFDPSTRRVTDVFCQ
jgi:hypothetical protein